MSIINDALKKAEREGLLKSQISPYLLKKELPQSKSSSLKNILSSLGIITVILVSFFFYNLSVKRIGMDKLESEKHKPLSSYSFPAKTKSTLGLKLSGIVFSGEEAWAVINDRILHKGDTIRGAKLMKIEENFVELALPHKKLVLKLEQP